MGSSPFEPTIRAPAAVPTTPLRDRRDAGVALPDLTMQVCATEQQSIAASLVRRPVGRAAVLSAEAISMQRAASSESSSTPSATVPAAPTSAPAGGATFSAVLDAETPSHAAADAPLPPMHYESGCGRSAAHSVLGSDKRTALAQSPTGSDRHSSARIQRVREDCRSRVAALANAQHAPRQSALSLLELVGSVGLDVDSTVEDEDGSEEDVQRAALRLKQVRHTSPARCAHADTPVLAAGLLRFARHGDRCMRPHLVMCDARWPASCHLHRCASIASRMIVQSAQQCGAQVISLLWTRPGRLWPSLRHASPRTTWNRLGCPHGYRRRRLHAHTKRQASRQNAAEVEAPLGYCLTALLLR